MLLIDIGNTAVKLALAGRQAIRRKAYHRTDMLHDASACLSLLESFCGSERPSLCLVSSVVPTVTPLMRAALSDMQIRRIAGVPDDLPVPLRNAYREPGTLGSDRLLAAYGARRLFPDVRGLLVADLGTAITIDGVEDDRFLGGLIIPGISASLEGLRLHAAQLQQSFPDYAEKRLTFGRTTEDCLGQGLAFGYFHMLQGLIRTLRQELPEDTIVLATGGTAGQIADADRLFDRVVPELVLEGLRFLARDLTGLS